MADTKTAKKGRSEGRPDRKRHKSMVKTAAKRNAKKASSFESRLRRTERKVERERQKKSIKVSKELRSLALSKLVDFSNLHNEVLFDAHLQKVCENDVRRTNFVDIQEKLVDYWMLCDGTIWCPTFKPAAIRAVIWKICASMYPGADIAVAFSYFMRELMKAKCIKYITSYLEAMAYTRNEAFDSADYDSVFVCHGYACCFETGKTFDLRKADDREVIKAMMLTRRGALKFDWTHSTEHEEFWRTSFERMFVTEEMVLLVEAAVVSCLVGVPLEQVLLMLGPGSNGKSWVMNLVLGFYVDIFEKPMETEEAEEAETEQAGEVGVVAEIAGAAVTEETDTAPEAEGDKQKAKQAGEAKESNCPTDKERDEQKGEEAGEVGVIEEIKSVAVTDEADGAPNIGGDLRSRSYCSEGFRALAVPTRADLVAQDFHVLKQSRAHFVREYRPNDGPLFTGLINRITGEKSIQIRRAHRSMEALRLEATVMIASNMDVRLSEYPGGDARRRYLVLRPACTYTKVKEDVDEDRKIFLASELAEDKDFMRGVRSSLLTYLVREVGPSLASRNYQVHTFIPSLASRDTNEYLDRQHPLFKVFWQVFEVVDNDDNCFVDYADIRLRLHRLVSGPWRDHEFLDHLTSHPRLQACYKREEKDSSTYHVFYKLQVKAINSE